MIALLELEPESISASSSHVITTSGSNCAETSVAELAIAAKISIVPTTVTTLDMTQRNSQLRIELLLNEYKIH
jgi:hypothetical protein